MSLARVQPRNGEDRSLACQLMPRLDRLIRWPGEKPLVIDAVIDDLDLLLRDAQFQNSSGRPRAHGNNGVRLLHHGDRSIVEPLRNRAQGVARRIAGRYFLAVDIKDDLRS